MIQRSVPRYQDTHVKFWGCVDVCVWVGGGEGYPQETLDERKAFGGNDLVQLQSSFLRPCAGHHHSCLQKLNLGGVHLERAPLTYELHQIVQVGSLLLSGSKQNSGSRNWAEYSCALGRGLTYVGGTAWGGGAIHC